MYPIESRLNTRFFNLVFFLPLVLIIDVFLILFFTSSSVAQINSFGSLVFAVVSGYCAFLMTRSVWRKAKIELICLFKGHYCIVISKDGVEIPLHVLSKSQKYHRRHPNLLTYRFNHTNIEYLSWLIVGLGGEMTSEVTLVLNNGKEYHLNPNNIGDRKKFLSKMVEYGNTQIISHTPSKPQSEES